MTYREIFQQMKKEEKIAITKLTKTLFLKKIKEDSFAKLSQKAQAIELNKLLKIEQRKAINNLNDHHLVSAIGKLKEHNLAITVSESYISRKHHSVPTNKQKENDRSDFRNNLLKYCESTSKFFTEVETVLLPCRQFAGDLLARVILDYLRQNYKEEDYILGYSNLNDAVIFYIRDKESAIKFHDVLFRDAGLMSDN